MSRKDFQNLDDEALLEYYHSTRNLKAFRLLYSRHKDSLYRYCIQMAPSGACSILEELWNGLLEQPPQLGGRRLRSWLFIRINRLLRNFTGTPLEASQNPEDQGNKLLAGIQQLSRIERNILLLHLECRLPLATVADIERISLRNCREYYRNGKVRLEEFLYGSKRQPWQIQEVEEASV
ncbi:RNA polymerase sigma factor [Microbulbifer taiwanensis]|uniref:RNA polymerase sigma factor n=1 Tax=Microbulbifer taiwanensis TaxID=986746 RepID=A0ABW1YQY8_9GAMM|nr:hypothetical protein [Microbulbifer taiwanensis]